MRNQMGFSLISFSFLIPLFFFIGMLLLGSYHLITRYTQIERGCREHVLSAQKILGQKLKDLMDLNPKAQSLRSQEQALRKAIKVALISRPPAAVALKALLEINLFRQGLLRGKQELILLSAVKEARKDIYQYQQEQKDLELRTSSIALRIYKNPPNALAPDHLTVPFFTELQTIQLHWKIRIQEVLPIEILNLFSGVAFPKNIQGQCSATLIKKGDVWNPILHLAKF